MPYAEPERASTQKSAGGGAVTYNSDALLQKTLGMFVRKWTKLG